MNSPPTEPRWRYLRLELPDVFDLLDTLTSDTEMPTFDECALMDALLATFYQREGGALRITATLDWMLESDGLSARLALSAEHKMRLRARLHNTLLTLERALLLINPYEDACLAWRYLQRRGRHGAILVRADPAR